MLYLVYGHKCLILGLIHSCIVMNTMICPHEGYYANSKYTCMLLSLTMVLKGINFKGLYLDF